MRSAAKLTYGGVARALKFTDKPPRSEQAESMLEGLKVLYELAMLHRSQRLRRGALDFELPEVKMVLDPKTGAPIGVEKRSEDPGVFECQVHAIRGAFPVGPGSGHVVRVAV